MINLHLGDCLEVLKALPDCSVDGIVTDPPYGLSFMGKKWDYDVPSVDVWAECLRVLKPGGHLLAFAGTRTQHRMAVRIEDAGFEIRDMIAWVYGSGFPKSLDVSKAIDKAAGAEREVVGFQARGNSVNTDFMSGGNNITAPATDAARQWAGWGTALKPALEPITMARKPLTGTVAENVQTYGTGGLNIEGCRVGAEQRYIPPAGNKPSGNSLNMSAIGMPQDATGTTASGRWPANLIHDGSDEVVGLFPDRKTTWVSPKHANNRGGDFLGELKHPGQQGFNDTGSAARFFYCAKSSKKDRGDGNTHPTVKPTDLMRYLCRLVTPPGGIVLDPFMGSGSTGKAAMLEGFQFIGIEKEQQYFDIAKSRINPGLNLLTQS
jgi:site-specific DNA-methyltransferase (adenine-specific)